MMVFAAEGDANTDWEPVTVSCEGFIPIPDKTDNGNSNSGGGVGGESEEQGRNASAAGTELQQHVFVLKELVFSKQL